jgi:UDP-N-acetylmuramate--alanine ligase
VTSSPSLDDVHILGLGGAGMSGIARILIAQGKRVSGSDLKDSRRLTALRNLGVEVFIGHNPENIHSNKSVIASTAIKENNVELTRARELGLAIYTRAEALRAITDGFQTVAIAGTHGKTTTTSMVTVALQNCELDPSFVIGSELAETGANAHLGHGEIFVVESDESDGSFLKLSPKVAVVTNVEPDHLDYWKQFEKLEQAFVDFVLKVKDENGFAVICLDDKGGKKLAQEVDQQIKVITYGQSEADLLITNVTAKLPGYSFNLSYQGEDLGIFELSVPGMHNVLNATAAVAVGIGMGFDVEKIRFALQKFTGTRRRFEYRGSVNKVRVFDDYAHHPTEITATLKAAREVVGSGKLIVAFQAHHYYRTALFNKEFGEALGLADIAIVLEVFAPGEEPIPGASGQTMASYVPLPEASVIFEPSWSQVANRLVERAAPNDIIMTLGAGDIGMLAGEILDLLAIKFADDK